MKKLFLAASLAFFGVISAQTEKGSFFISGKTNLGFTSNTIKYKAQGQTFDGSKTNTFTISPNAGYFIVDNLALGLALDYKTSTTKTKTGTEIESPYDPTFTNGTKEKQTTLSIIPNVTYFFSEGKTRPYLNTGVGFANTKNKNNYTMYNSSGDILFSSSETKNDGFVWTANGGLIFLITENIALDLGLGYTNYSFKNDGVKINSGAFGANAGISVFLK